ncbi:MAG: iron-containing alcohol dehydrogenase [Haloferacaceae archaeon]
MDGNPDLVSSTSLRFRAPDFRFGDGVVEALPAALDRLGVQRPLVVTDEGVAAAGVLDDALAAYDGPYTRYDAATEPSTDDFADLPDDVDGVVAVGGGSCLDTAKVAAILLTHDADPASLLGVGKLTEPVAPLVAVPTTSGTGSQSTQTAVVHHEGVKRGISDERMRPDVALVDPSLTFGLPRTVTARSGFDGFVHALESLTARDYRWVEPRPITYQGANPVSRSFSRRALHLMAGNLERATFDGADRDARRAVSLGSHLAGLAFSNAGLGAVHALASAVGGMVDRPHGECLAVSVEPGLRYNLPVRREEYAAVARDLGVGDDAEDLIAAATRLRDSLALPESFAAFGLDESDVDEIVEKTLVQERRIKTNPREVTEDLRAVVAASFA